jgi:hypothetical protein
MMIESNEALTNFANHSPEQADDDVEDGGARTTKKTEIEFAQVETTSIVATHPSSDFSFLCGLTEPIDTSPSNFPLDLASFAAILATETTDMSSCWVTAKSVVIQLAANFVVWIKIILLSSILIDSINPRCTSNGQCKPGLFCFPLKLAYPDLTDWPTETRGNSFCNDCLFATVLLNNETSTPSEAEAFLQAGRDYCVNDDPERCDFLQANRGKYSYLSFLVLCCLCGMFCRLIYLDLHKLHVQQRLYEYRLELMKMAAKTSQQRQHIGTTIRVYLTAAINWFAYASRAYILPSWMFTGAALLLTTWAPTTRNLILVPIQIGLIANFDMVLEFLFLSQTHKDYTKNAAGALELQQLSSSHVTTYDKVLAVLIRLYSLGLAVQIPIFVLMAESIFPAVSFVRNAVGPNNPKYNFPIPLPCNDVVAAGIYFPLLLTVPMTLLIGPVANRCQCSTLHVLGYVSTFVFVVYSCFLVREFMVALQFRSF